MKPLMVHVLRDHVALGAIVGALLFPSWGFWPTLLFWLANVLIDIDHYFHFLWAARFRWLSFYSMFRFHEYAFQNRNSADFFAVEIFHTVEFLVVFAYFAFAVFPPLQPLFWGMLFHNAVDLVHLGRHGILTKRAHSFLEYGLRRRKIRLRGGDPDLVFRESLELLKSSCA